MSSLPNSLLSRWKLFPIETNGKRPLTANGFKDASSDEWQLSAWAVQFPGCNWAVATGEVSGIFVVDVDGEKGAASVDSFLAQGLTLPNTLTASTGREDGGWHLYFAMPVGAAIGCSTGKLAEGLDVKANGGYVVIPPSTHASGKRYSFIDPNTPIADSPQWLLNMLARPALALVPPISSVVLPREPSEYERATAAKALRSEVEKLTKTTSGRNAALNTAALHLGEMIAAGWIERSTVEQALWAAAITNGYIDKDGPEDARKTLQSGLTSGMKKPRQPLLEAPSLDAVTMVAFQRLNPCIHNAPVWQAPTNSDVEVLTMAEISEENTEWLWNGYLPKGKLTLLAGAAGTGKSTIAFSMAATVSTAGLWPDNTRCTEPGTAMIFSTEDDVADTIKPRLIAMGANNSRVCVISSMNHNGQGKLPFNPATDMPALKRYAIANGGVALLIIDPITSAVTGDMNKSNEVRRGLQSVVEFASELNCAVLGITHFSKGTTGRNPADRVIGSQAFAAFARMVLVAAKDEESNNRVFTRAKSNIGLDTGGFNYTIQPVVISHGIVATRIEWGGAITGSSRDILAKVEHQEGKDEPAHSGIHEATQFLIEELAKGSRYQKHLVDEAKERLGIQERTLQRARQKLGVTTRKQSNGNWMWSLAPQPHSNG